MAQCDHKVENSPCLSSGFITNMHSFFGNALPADNLTSQTSAEKATEQFSLEDALLETNSTEDTDKSSETLNQLEDFSPSFDISSALRSGALMRAWDFRKMFSAPQLEEDNGTFSPLADQDQAPDGDEEEEGVQSESFQSKYIHIFPLYQDYCLQKAEDEEGYVSEVVTSQFLPNLQSTCNPRNHFKTRPRCPEGIESSPLVLRVTPCALWQDLDEVKASGLLGSLTAREIRLQESMFELICSEASYLRSLEVAVNHFRASKTLKRSLSQMEHHVLFSNLRRVMAANAKFLMHLEIRLGECVLISQIGDVVLQHCPAFRTLYVPYVTNMMYQEALVNQLLQQNKEFVFALKRLESDPVCQRQSLKSFLVLPFQRITRLKLLLESILKLTEPQSEPSSNLGKAIEAIHEIVTECDKGVRKMKRIEELVCLEMLLDFGKLKSLPLVVSGRFVAHQGPMRQLTLEGAYRCRMSFISIYLHLFNDLLIISSKNAQRFQVLDHAEFPTHVHVEHVKTEVLGLPPESFLLRLSQSQTGHPTVFILAPYTRSDKAAWMKVLSSKH